MNAREITKDMKSHFNRGFITRKDLADYMGIKDPHNVDRFLRGLERVDGKYYFIGDIAETLKGRSTIA